MFQHNLNNSDAKDVDHFVGEYITPCFFKYEHVQLNIPRDPYTTSPEWLAAHMEFLFHDIRM